jgi:uncharacterized phosphosugar-binding protein
MGTLENYFTRITELLDRIIKEQQDNIDRAAAEIVKRLKEDRLVYVIGTGAHSMMVAMEMFKRAGGISQISPLFPPGLGDFEGHPKTERLTGYAALSLDYYKVEKGDVLIIANVNGINSLTIDCALECKRRGITSIGITSSMFSRGCPAGNRRRGRPCGPGLDLSYGLYRQLHCASGDRNADRAWYDS